jgi:hypothetical protein
MYARVSEDMDLNCETIVDGTATVQAAGRQIFELILAVASGQGLRARASASATRSSRRGNWAPFCDRSNGEDSCGSAGALPRPFDMVVIAPTYYQAECGSRYEGTVPLVCNRCSSRVRPGDRETANTAERDTTWLGWWPLSTTERPGSTSRGLRLGAASPRRHELRINRFRTYHLIHEHDNKWGINPVIREI